MQCLRGLTFSVKIQYTQIASYNIYAGAISTGGMPPVRLIIVYAMSEEYYYQMEV